MKRFANALMFLGCLMVFPTMESADASMESADASILATELQNGVPVGNLSADTGGWLHFTIAVPSDSANLVMEIYGGTGDADLYTLFGAQPTTSNYDCGPFLFGNDEACLVSFPSAGTYYVSIHACEAFSGVTVKATYEEAPLAQELRNGQPVGVSGAQDSWKHFLINVPSGQARLEVKLSGGSGDADLYTRFGVPPTDEDYDCRSFAAGNDELCAVANPQAGTYYIGVHAYDEYSGVTLVATYGEPPAAQELQNGQTVAVSGSQGSWRHFFISVPAGQPSLEMKLSGGSGDADLYTKYGTMPTISDFDCRPFLGGNDETCTVTNPQAGDYYISVHAYMDYDGASLVATYASGGGTFIVTAVDDNLDHGDMVRMKNGLEGLGYTQEIMDTNVSSSELTSYLAMNVTTIYHTGHGYSGGVATSDGSISYSNVTLNAENTFFATCLTLIPTEWTSRFGSTANTLMGYTNKSYDNLDNTVVDNTIDELENGRSYPLAWYLANAGISYLSDRWAEYVREGSSIVEYSARSGNTPSSLTASDEWIAVESSGRVRVAPELAMDTRKFVGAFRNRLAFEAADTVTFADPAGLVLLGPVEEDQVHEVALEWLADLGGVPNDAVLDRVVPVERYDGAQTEIVGYSFHYQREMDGVAIGGNRVADHLTLLVGPDAVVAASRYWPTITTGVTRDVSESLLGVRTAISLAADEISQIVKGTGPIHLVAVQPVHGTRGPHQGDNQLRPAYEVQSANGLRFVIDAQTGDLLL
jgi:hypothetical protein